MSIAHIELYHSPGTRSARVKWLLHEVFGENFSINNVRLFKGEQHRPSFLALNPNHAVPTVRLDLLDGRSVVMFETGAIINVIADAYIEKGLAPLPTPFSVERSEFLQMLYFCAATLDPLLWQIRLNLQLLPVAERHTNTILRSKAKIAREIEPQLRKRLAAAPFICGQSFSAADCMYGHAVVWAQKYELCCGREFEDYKSRLVLRPAYLEAFADADGFLPNTPKAENA